MSLTNTSILITCKGKESAAVKAALKYCKIPFRSAATSKIGPIFIQDGRAYTGVNEIEVHLSRKHPLVAVVLHRNHGKSECVQLGEFFQEYERKKPYSFREAFSLCENIIASNMWQLPVEYGPRELFLHARSLGIIKELRNGTIRIQDILKKLDGFVNCQTK